MKSIVLDARSWRTEDDFYDAILAALGAPDRHGRNLDALWDTIAGDDTNEVKAPYTIEILQTESLSPMLRTLLRRFVALVQDARSERGVVVSAVARPPL